MTEEGRDDGRVHVLAEVRTNPASFALAFAPSAASFTCTRGAASSQLALAPTAASFTCTQIAASFGLALAPSAATLTRSRFRRERRRGSTSTSAHDQKP